MRNTESRLTNHEQGQDVRLQHKFKRFTVLAFMLFSAAFTPARAEENRSHGILLESRFFVEPYVDPTTSTHIPAPTARGRIGAQDAANQGPLTDHPTENEPLALLIPGPDIYVADGAETALAIDPGNGNNLAAALNQAFLGSPKLRTSSNGNVSWTTRTFPTGTGIYTFFAGDPCSDSGNAAGEMFVGFLWFNSMDNNTHTVVARTTNGGTTWPKFFEVPLDVGQDHPTLSVDRTTARGGGAGSAHDGKVYLCYDNWGVNFGSYTNSVVQVISSAGTALSTLTVSTAGTFRGSQGYPVAGTVDGQAYVMSLSDTVTGTTRPGSFKSSLCCRSGRGLRRDGRRGGGVRRLCF